MEYIRALGRLIRVRCGVDPLSRIGAKQFLPEFERRDAVELVALVATGALHPLCFSVLNAKGAYVVSAIVGWGAYIGWTARRDPERLRAWGLRYDGLVASCRAIMPFTIVAAVGTTLVGVLREASPDPLHLALSVLLYPIWGVVQQLLVQGILVRFLARRLPSVAVVPVAATVFGLVHAANPALLVATTVLGGTFTAVYVRHQNVWPLGVAHGVLGAMFYFLVLGRDPFAEVMLATAPNEG